jgi:hypothetical protein
MLSALGVSFQMTSTLDFRQLIIKGLQIDEIPWYSLAWYAFDSFVKLNDEA